MKGLKKIETRLHENPLQLCVCMFDTADFQDPTWALGSCCPHTACPLLIAGRCDGPTLSVTPRPRGRTYQVWSITVQLSSVAITTLLPWTACIRLCHQFRLFWHIHFLRYVNSYRKSYPIFHLNMSFWFCMSKRPNEKLQAESKIKHFSSSRVLHVLITDCGKL
jgi:hypothetical protein